MFRVTKAGNRGTSKKAWVAILVSSQHETGTCEAALSNVIMSTHVGVPHLRMMRSPYRRIYPSFLLAMAPIKGARKIDLSGAMAVRERKQAKIDLTAT